ncbi:MAG: hypothetical protein QOH76_3950 [Thermoleophilaceae bacterium]|jgi:hypothetical protein|nr:hypothetical protein [Thermoleophilaceae bacterium]
MSLALLHPTSAVEGLFPATLVGGLGATLDDARGALRLGTEQTHPAPGHAVIAELAVPRGTWRIWPERGLAAWLGRRRSELPRVDEQTAPVTLDLPDAVRHLHARGLWCMEVRLLDGDGWTRPMDAYEGLTDLVRRGVEVEGISGIFSGGQTGPARVEMYRDGRVLASDPLDAERWLLVVHGLDDDV